MQPILIIYTGGTIGMRTSSEGYQPCDGIQTLIESSLSMAAFAELQPYQVHEFDNLIDSSNALPSNWLEIAQCIKDHYQQYSAFIVLHGTDTMAYTAAALHHLLGENIKPVIVTGSQIPMCEARSDASSNLLEAALFARSGKVAQVCISFAGKLLAGNSAKKVHTSAMAAFDSLNRPPLALANIALDFSQNTVTMSNAKTDKSFEFPSLQEKSVAVIFLYPGINDSVINAAFLDSQTTAVVMLSYGAGNPPDQNLCLIKALESAQQRNIPVINITQCYSGSVSQGTYAVGSVLNKFGVISAGNRTLEDVVTSLYIKD